MSKGNSNKFRFAPSPNGPLHLGHAYSALKTSELAKQLGGEFCLRIEDIDKSRSQETYIEAIYRDLKWLGLKWPEPVRRQSDHFADYRSPIEKLRRRGLLYPCFASRKDIEKAYQEKRVKPRDPDGALLYPGLYKDAEPEKISILMENNTPHALRLDMEKAAKMAQEMAPNSFSYQSFAMDGASKVHKITPERWGDVIIVRKDIPTSYHLSVVFDDYLEKITHITRGLDLEASTDVHRVLQIILKLPEPLYHHHELVTTNEGEKLSKSKQHRSLHDLRCNGLDARKIREIAKNGAKELSNLLF